MVARPFNPILNILKKNINLEYTGTVENNADPLMLGKIQVRIDLWEDLLPEYLPWASPTPSAFLGASNNSGSFHVPNIGTQVKIYFPTMDYNNPYYRGVELNSRNKCTLFDTDYPNTYGNIDEKGNFYIVNRKTGLTQYQHSSTTNIQIKKDGTYIISTPNGSYILSTASGEITRNITAQTTSVSGTTTLLQNGTSYAFQTDDGGGMVEQGSDMLLNFNTGIFTGDLSVSGQITSDIGYSGTFSTQDGQTVTISGGLIVDVS
jgi:hypothetical protein